MLFWCLILAVMLHVLCGIHALPVNQFHAWTLCHDFKRGEFDGEVVCEKVDGPLMLKNGSTHGIWTSDAFDMNYPVTRIIPSWNANTPPGTWVETRLSVQINGHWSKWFSMGKWAFDASAIKRSSVDGQKSADGDLSTDTYDAPNHAIVSAYKLQIELQVKSGTASPTVRQISATTFEPKPPSRVPSNTTMEKDIELHVPQYSQIIHHNEFPEYGGGGSAWCSPTSSQMVMEFWDHKPSVENLKTLTDPVFNQHGRKDGSVVWAALHTFDWTYHGTGNWPFNSAYAAHYGLDASVRRFNSLQDIEHWIKIGVPVIASISWDTNASDHMRHMDNAGISKTEGHLLVIRGFTHSGDVIVNDPANSDDASVRRIYKRDQFEYNWQFASHGIVYLYKPLTIPG